MATVVISPAFQVRLPKSAREALQLAPGQQLRVVQYAGRLELVPVRPMLDGAALFGEPPSDSQADSVLASRGIRPQDPAEDAIPRLRRRVEPP